MANLKISELTDATLPLNDADLFEIVQGGVNKKAPKSAVGSTPSDSSETVKGIIEIATQAETNTGTDDVRALTPLKAAARYAPLASPALTGTPTVPTAAATTNTAQAASTAFVQQEIAAKTVGVQDLFIPASAMIARLTNGAALAQVEMATSLLNILAQAFDQTTQEFVQFTVALPRKWNNGTVTIVPYWTAQSGTGTVQWGISGGAYSNDDALTVAFGSAQTSDDTLIATNDLHIGPATSAITLAGTPADADYLAIQVSRNPASDTLNADALLLGISIRITTDAAIDA